MTVEQLQAKIKKASANLSKEFPAISYAACAEMEKKIKDRVFIKGKDSEGNLIKDGKYSEKPMYVNPDKLPIAIAGQAGGKPTKKGNTTRDTKLQKSRTAQQKITSSRFGFINKTLYLPHGYKELREKAGLETQVVNLERTGASRQTIKIVEQNGKPVLAVTEQLAADIFRGQEKENGEKIIDPSKQEAQEITDYITERLGETFKTIFV